MAMRRVRKRLKFLESSGLLAEAARSCDCARDAVAQLVLSTAREAELSGFVEHAIARIEAGAASAALPPMSSYERKLVHDLVAARGFSSESEGEGRDRHTVITHA